MSSSEAASILFLAGSFSTYICKASFGYFSSYSRINIAMGKFSTSSSVLPAQTLLSKPIKSSSFYLAN